MVTAVHILAALTSTRLTARLQPSSRHQMVLTTIGSVCLGAARARLLLPHTCGVEEHHGWCLTVPCASALRVWLRPCGVRLLRDAARCVRCMPTGSSVAISGENVVVGAYGDDTATGSIYVYKVDGAFAAKLTAPDGADQDSFGVLGSCSRPLASSAHIDTCGDVEHHGWCLAVPCASALRVCGHVASAC